MGDGKCSDCFHQHPWTAHDQQQVQHEHQVIEAQQGVFDAEPAPCTPRGLLVNSQYCGNCGVANYIPIDGPV